MYGSLRTFHCTKGTLQRQNVLCIITIFFTLRKCFTFHITYVFHTKKANCIRYKIIKPSGFCKQIILNNLFSAICNFLITGVKVIFMYMVHTGGVHHSTFHPYRDFSQHIFNRVWQEMTSVLNSMSATVAKNVHITGWDVCMICQIHTNREEKHFNPVKPDV